MVYKNVPEWVHAEFVECTGDSDVMYKKFIDELKPTQISRLQHESTYVYDLLMAYTIQQLNVAIENVHKPLR